MSDIVISVENVSKIYRLGEVGTGSLAHDVNRWWHRIRGKEDPYLKVGQVNDRTKAAKNPSTDGGRSDDWVYALKDISFQVKRGEVLGIIGRNGAGKSTLLKILSRVTTQTSGKIKVKGRIASLLEVGTGFHPELTGRENVFLNGAILGMRRTEIASKFDEIVDFSGCARYIDTPVKRYSSGMYVRLAFAVAAHLEPEILIVDEVLAVGDSEFQRKCLGKMRDAAGSGRTVLFVSHNMGAIKSLCRTGLALENGEVYNLGIASDVVEKYSERAIAQNVKIIQTSDLRRRDSLGQKLKVSKLEWVSGPKLRHGEPMTVRVYYETYEKSEDVSLAIGFSSIEGARLITYETDFKSGRRESLEAKIAGYVDFQIEEVVLAPGTYSVSLGSRSGDSHALDYLENVCNIEVIMGKGTPPYIARAGAAVRIDAKSTWSKC